MEIVLDTNVLVSSLWGGPPKLILNACRAGQIRLLVSPSILKEYFAVLSRFDPDEEDADQFQALFADPARVKTIAPAIRIHAVAADPSDDKFIECAAAGKAKFIVSGDKHLLRVNGFHGIAVVTPSVFLKALI